MKCLQCQKKFKAKRSDAVFCSSKCKTYYHRNCHKNVTDNNSKKVILSLCDHSGNWLMPYREEGYDVRQIDLKHGQDVRLMMIPKEKIYGILAAPPCTEFSSSGARWWESKGEPALLSGLSIFDACCRLVLFCDPVFWAFENPAGRLKHYIGEPAFLFNPCDYGSHGEAYTKKTCLWGKFNAPKPKGQLKPTTGRTGHHSIDEFLIHEQGKNLSSFEKRNQARSVTPLGFSFAFFEANQ